MKEKVLLLIVFLISSTFFVFSQNNQTLIPANSKVYDYLKVLLSEQGRVLDFLERPASRNIIINSLEDIDYNKLSDSSKVIYTELFNELKPTPIYQEEDKLAVDFSMDIILETYFQTDSSHINWLKPDSERSDFITIPLEWWIFDSIYGKMDFLLAKNPFLYEQIPAHDGYWINIPVNISQIDFQYPYVGYLAAGGDHWDMQIGRDNLNYGSGRSGNFLVSGNLPYYSFFRVKTFWEKFSYNYTLMDLEPWSTDTGLSSLYSGDYEQIPKTLVSHGFTFNIIPKTRFGFKEYLLFGNFNPSLNYLNPFMIFHNYYVGGFNSFLTVDIEVNVLKGINIYGVLAVDQYQTAYEIDRYDATAIPNAYGYLVGADFSIPYSKGYWYGNVEWVYTNPWLYLDEVSDASFVWTGYIVSNEGGRYLKNLPFGYPSGPDSMNLFTSLGYTKLHKYSFEGGYTLQMKGEQNLIDTLWSDAEGAASLQTPTGITEISHSVWIDAVWYPSFYFHLKEIGTGIAYAFIENEGNINNADYQDFQWSFHISLSY